MNTVARHLVLFCIITAAATWFGGWASVAFALGWVFREYVWPSLERWGDAG